MGTKLPAESVSELYETIKKSAKMSPFVSRASKFFAKAEAKDLSNVKLDFEDEVEDEEAENAANVTVNKMVNKLVKLFTKMIQKISDHAKAIKFNREVIEDVSKEVNSLQEKEKEKSENMDKLKAECLKLKETLIKAEEHSDEIQQRSMKGNLIVSSPNRDQKPSILNKKERIFGNVSRMEDDTEMIIRLIKEKTGVEFLVGDISACHILKKQGADSSFILRVVNRRPGSAWEVLSAGLLTGRNFESGKNFTDANVYVNFQLTKRRGALSKKVREAKYDKGVNKYGTDQNGRITVKVNPDSPWVEVTSPTHLEQLIASPPAHRAPRPAWGQGQRHQ